MNLRPYIVPVLIAGWLAYALIAGRGGTAPQHEAELASTPTDSRIETVTQTDDGTEEIQTPSQPTALAPLELERSKRQRAAEKMEDLRKDLQATRSDAWSAVLVTNWTAFKALRQKAAASPNGQTHCTLCDGTGHMHVCVLCHNSGQCPTCGGSGKLGRDDYCPTCLGKGICYLCRGSKGMTCPFCDDGTIDVKGPMPPGMLPLN